MNIEDMETAEIVKYLGTRYDSLICAGATVSRSGSVTVGTYLRGREALPYVLDDVKYKVEQFLEKPEPPKPTKPKGNHPFRVIK
jgi:hypothetical protein